jgi:hypothetical protein
VKNSPSGFESERWMESGPDTLSGLRPRLDSLRKARLNGKLLAGRARGVQAVGGLVSETEPTRRNESEINSIQRIEQKVTKATKLRQETRERRKMLMI